MFVTLVTFFAYPIKRLGPRFDLVVKSVQDIFISQLGPCPWRIDSFAKGFVVRAKNMFMNTADMISEVIHAFEPLLTPSLATRIWTIIYLAFLKQQLLNKSVFCFVMTIKIEEPLGSIVTIAKKTCVGIRIPFELGTRFRIRRRQFVPLVAFSLFAGGQAGAIGSVAFCAAMLAIGVKIANFRKIKRFNSSTLVFFQCLQSWLTTLFLRRLNVFTPWSRRDGGIAMKGNMNAFDSLTAARVANKTALHGARSSLIRSQLLKMLILVLVVRGRNTRR